MRATVLATAICSSLASLATAADVNAAIKRATDIPPQALAPALQRLVKERDIQLVYRAELIADRETSGATGEITSVEALHQLLDGTGLTYRYLDGETITIVPIAVGSSDSDEVTSRDTASDKNTTAANAKEAQTARSFWDRFRLAQVDQGKALEGRPVAISKGDSATVNGASIEEVIVTAQKREQVLTDVPMSIGVISAEQLDQRGISDTVDIALSVPGLGIQDRGGASLRYVFLRGLGNTRGSQTMVGVYLDDQDLTSFPFNALDLRAYDLERLEVLRGPQGTLYGSGAMGGVLRYITKRTDLSRSEGDAYVSVATTDNGDPSRLVGGSLNMPIITDTLGVRVAGLYEHDGGWIDQPAASRSDINDEELYSFRVKGLWKPTDALEVSSTIMVHHNDAGAPNVGEDKDGNFTQSFGRTSTPSGSNRFETYGFVAKYSARAFEILSSTGYFDYENSQKDVGYAFPTAPPPAVANDLLSDPFLDTSVRVLTQELRASSIGASRFNWTAGASFREAEGRGSAALLFGLPTAVAPVRFVTPTDESSRGWAIFGEGSMAFGRTTWGAGLRYYKDTQENEITRQSADFDQFSPRFFGTLAITDEVNLYANVAKGFRSGGFNTPFSISRGAPPTFESDLIWSYELGSKGTLLNGRVRFDLAVFYSDYEGAQDSGFREVDGAVINLVGNIGDAVIKGVDWDVALMIAQSISIGTAGEYLDGKFTRIDAISATQAAGDPLKQIPEYHANVWAMYETVGWLGSEQAYVRVEYNRHGVAEYRNRSIGPWYVSESDPIDMLNASIGWQKGNWSVSLFARNLLDDRGYIDAESIDRLASRPRPRTYGIKTAVSF